MARVTVEDCVEKVPNRFELVLLAGQRAKNISAGEPLTVDRDNDKNSVVALREIAEGTVSVQDVDNMLVTGFQKMAPVDSLMEEEVELAELGKELCGEDAYASEAKEATSDVLAQEQDFAQSESFQVTDAPEDEA